MCIGVRGAKEVRCLLQCIFIKDRILIGTIKGYGGQNILLGPDPVTVPVTTPDDDTQVRRSCMGSAG